MKEYNFDENKSMGETVRIDDIKLKLAQMEFEEVSDEDYDDFEEIDEPTPFDDAEDDFDRTETQPVKPVPPVRRKKPDRGGRPPERNRKNGGGSNRFLFYIICAVIMVAVIVGVVVAALGSRKGDIEEETAEADGFYGVVESVSGNRFEITDTENGETDIYTVDSTVPVTREDGKLSSYSSVTRGDIVYIGTAKETGEVVSIDYTDSVWEIDGFEKPVVDLKEKTISNASGTYDYNGSSLFIYNGEFIHPDDILPEDTVTLRGMENTVWTVSVEKYHGFIELKNVDKIESPVITIDGREAEFKENRTAVSSGAHSLGISGSNIDNLTVEIHVPAGEVYSVDMASVQEKTGVLTVSVNVENSIIVVDGKQVEEGSTIVLSHGTYPISVSAEGYRTYSGTVNINEPLVEEVIELEKIQVQTATITVESEPSGASVYANNAVIGVTPFTTQINYGDFDILIKKDGYIDYNLSTTVNESTKKISVMLTEE